MCFLCIRKLPLKCKTNWKKEEFKLSKEISLKNVKLT